MSYPQKEVSLIAYFPEERYSKNMPILRIQGHATGSNLFVALKRAFQDVFKDPQIFHKSPLIIYVSVGVDGEQPIDLYQRVEALHK